MKSFKKFFYVICALLLSSIKGNIMQGNVQNIPQNANWNQGQMVNQNNMMMTNFSNPNNQMNMYNPNALQMNGRGLRVNPNAQPYMNFKPVQPLTHVNKNANPK
jgi:hypothetical protein